MILFLFPSDYFNPKQIDEMYADQFTTMNDAGLNTAVISLESLESKSPRINPAIPQNSQVVYRGWMLSPSDYELLVKAVETSGASAFTSQAEYLLTHYLPNWYPLIPDLTPATKFYTVDDDLESELKKLAWERFFIKDYVKSLKTSIGSIVQQPSEIKMVITEMQKFRGTIEGGICVRQLEDFAVESERRYFVVCGQPFAADLDEKIPDIVRECAVRIKSNFFCVDVVDRKDGVKRIVEIGDGQVSDILGWSAERFAQLWGDETERAVCS